MKRAIARHQGITILEVLIAMGIALFGLLAVMAIVPYAARQARDGLDMEETAQVGQRAVSDVMVMDLANPARWMTVGGNPQLPGGYTTFDHFLEGAGAPAGPETRFFHDEAILIDPQFFGANVITHFPYCFQPQLFVDVVNGPTAFREPLTGAVPQPAFTGQLTAGGDPLESIAPYVRRVGLFNPGSSGSPMPFAMSREIFETADDIVTRELTDAEKLAIPQFEKGKRLQYLVRTDPGTGNTLTAKVVSQGRTSWLPMLVPMNDSRTLWKLFIIVVRDRDPAFAVNLLNERVARIRGTNRYTVNSGFASNGTRGGLVRIESWGTTNLAGNSAVPGTSAWDSMSSDVAIQAGQWVLLSRFDQTGATNPAVRRVYQWYRVTDASADIEFSAPDTKSFNTEAGVGVGVRVPSRLITLSGPDWDAGPDALVFVMNNVEAVYERTIEMPSGLLPTPRTP